jgi:hypothetical protein
MTYCLNCKYGVPFKFTDVDLPYVQCTKETGEMAAAMHIFKEEHAVDMPCYIVKEPNKNEELKLINYRVQDSCSNCSNCYYNMYTDRYQCRKAKYTCVMREGTCDEYDRDEDV